LRPLRRRTLVQQQSRKRRGCRHRGRQRTLANPSAWAEDQVVVRPLLAAYPAGLPAARTSAAKRRALVALPEWPAPALRSTQTNPTGELAGRWARSRDVQQRRAQENHPLAGPAGTVGLSTECRSSSCPQRCRCTVGQPGLVPRIRCDRPAQLSASEAAR